MPDGLTWFVEPQDALADVMERLGEVMINQADHSISGVSAEKGRKIVFEGKSLDAKNQRMTRLQSPYFKCISCHNTTKEYKSLTNISADDKLARSIETGKPFVQASTFYGIVNRKTFIFKSLSSKV